MRIVQKYGGSSLADEACVRRVAKRIAADAVQNDILVVVSAQGKTTDALTDRYCALSTEFPSRESDHLLVTGELVSAALLAAALRELNVSAISLDATQVPIIAKGPFGNGKILRIGRRRIRKEWKRGRVVIVTGFQGVTEGGDFITLGRGGSDTSAVALAVALKADRCMIFTDVDGVYSADPRKVPYARRFASIHTDTMLELAKNGAKVLHPGSVEIAKQHGLTLTVLTSFSLSPGTEVSLSAPQRTGITVGIEGETATVCIVFAQRPADAILACLSDICDDYGCTPVTDGVCYRVSLPSQDADAVLNRFHAVLYPS